MCDLMSSTYGTTAVTNTISTNSTTTNTNPKSGKLLADYKQIILELRAQNFDVIRFATYRTASKLRFIQKKLNLHLIDLWNVIETFRDNNLHTLDLLNELETNKLESCIQNMYSQLNKRLAFNQHINVDTQTQLLLAWLLNLYDKNRLSKIKVFSVKIALTTMCAGKLVDKLKYIFNQISDQSKNTLILTKFELYLKELLVLPKSVFEEPSFGYNENISKTCFDLNAPVRLEDFLSVALSDVGPPCFIWLNIFHRFTIVQNVTHPVKCSACERTNFNGFRYKCQKCRKYQLCQDCFWRGRISHSHQLTHQMKEYTSYKSAAKQISNSLRKSFFCKPNKQTSQLQKQQQAQLQKMPINQSSHYANTNNSTNNNNINTHTNTMLSQSINVVSSNATSSDYNLLYRNKDTNSTNKSSLEATKLQAQTLNNINSNSLAYSLPAATSLPITASNDIYSNLTKSSPKAKKIFQQLSLSSNIEENYLNDSNNKLIHQPIDLTHIVPSMEIKLAQQSINQFQSSMAKPTNNYSNTLSMTRSRNSDNLNFGSANAVPLQSSSTSTQLNTDEHNIIANYCSRLADFYVKNPHLSSSPTSNTPSPKILPKSSTVNKLKTNLKLNKPIPNCSKPSNDFSSQSMMPISSSRTASLSRQAWSTNRTKFNNYLTNTISSTTNYNDTSAQHQQQQQTSIIPDTKAAYATRSLSESNFRSNSDDSPDSLENIDDKLLREKREIVAKLEKQNREILKEIKRLRLKQLSNRSLDLTDEQHVPQIPQYNQLAQHLSLKNQQYNRKDALTAPSSCTLSRKILLNSGTLPKVDPNILAELHTLKQKKGQLENRMQLLENSRDELIGRLTQLDTLIGAQSVKQQNQENLQRIVSSGSLKTSPTLSPRSAPNKTQFVPIVPAPVQSKAQHQHRPGIITNVAQPRSWSTPSTPALFELHPTRSQQQTLITKQQIASSLVPSTSSLLSLNGLSNTSSVSDHNRLLRNDLLIAADSVTNAMQNLVKELHSENECLNSNTSEDEEEEESFKLIQPKVTSYSASATPVTYRKNLSFSRKVNGQDNNYEEELSEDEDGADLEQENMLYENYLIAESFIDDLNGNNNEEFNMDNGEQVALWRRELEQILIEDTKPGDTTATNEQEQSKQ